MIGPNMTKLKRTLPGRWVRQAVCGNMAPAIFFPERGGTTVEAKRICFGCPVRPECLEYALSMHERHGVWGGLTPHERRRYRLIQSVRNGSR